jgi:hypothetical protein
MIHNRSGAARAATAACAAIVLGLAVLAGCGETVTTTPGDGTHPTTWSDQNATDFHGTAAEQTGFGACMGCHGYNLLGKGTAPSCDQCHDVPATHHAAGWEAGAVHGAPVRPAGAAACAVCHGSDYAGGTARVSCYACHNGRGGHPAGWRSSSVHGSYAESHGTSSCSVCHGADYRGGWAAVSCYQCHGGPNG